MSGFKSVFEFRLVDVPEEDIEAAYQFAQPAVAAGVRLSLADWLGLEPADRIAFMRARYEQDLETQLFQAEARDDAQLAKARLVSKLDGGQAFKHLNLRRTAERIAQRLRAADG